MTRKLHFAVLPDAQQTVWRVLVQRAAAFLNGGYYLAGGTALALQLGHRQSVDFDFFSQQPGLAGTMEEVLQPIPGFLVRDIEPDTLHAEIGGVKLSFIGAYRYPLLEQPLDVEGMRLAGLLDIGVMKLLALSHRATPRDYIDLAAILRAGCTLPDLLAACNRKYGDAFNPMVPLRALVSFQDIEGETPTMLDVQLASSWQDVLRSAVRAVGGNV
jgi:hypothetical protein